jgi:hypothetical protein
MKKNFRKIPDFILAKSNNIENNYQIVSTTILLKENELDLESHKRLGLSIKDGELVYQNEFIPLSVNGKYSKRNALGYTRIRRDLPKVYKTIDCGERPYFGKWEKGSFTLIITKQVYQRERIAPREISMGIELLDTTTVNNVKQFLIKVAVLDILDKNSPTFQNDLLFDVNLLQENVSKVDIFNSEAKYEDYLKSYFVTWDFFPPGHRDADIAKILSVYRNPTNEIKEQIQERYDYLRSLNPKDFIYGLSGIRRYFGARFADNLVVFDNLQYGNAIYVLFERWEELSKLSRTEIQKRPENEFVYIKHGNGWKIQLKHVIEKRLNAA